MSPTEASARMSSASGGPWPHLRSSGSRFWQDGTPIEYTRAIGRGDLLTLAINMVADKADFRRRIGL